MKGRRSLVINKFLIFFFSWGFGRIPKLFFFFTWYLSQIGVGHQVRFFFFTWYLEPDTQCAG